MHDDDKPDGLRPIAEPIGRVLAAMWLRLPDKGGGA